MIFQTESNVYEPFEEFVQQVGRKPLDDVSSPIFVLMINQLKMTKLVSLRSVIQFQENFSQSETRK